MKIFLIGLVVLATFPAFASELNCIEKNWSFVIDGNEDQKVGSLIFRGNIVERVKMVKKSVKTPEYSKLKALYEGRTSVDSYDMYVFKKKENEAYISFLETKSTLGHKKVIELRCTLKP